MALEFILPWEQRATMRIHQIRIQNFRGIEDMTLELDPKLTVLVGANNAGKTTVLDALEAIISFPKAKPPFLDTDFRATAELADVRQLKPIEITVDLVPTEGASFGQDEMVDDINPQYGVEGSAFVRLKLKASYKREPDAVETELVVLDPKGAAIGERVWSRFPFREAIPYHCFGAERDLRRGMGGRWTDWKAILGEVRPNAETLKAAAEHFEKASSTLLNTEEFQKIQNALSPGGNAVGLQEATLELSAAPQDASELLERVYVELKLPGAPRGFSAERHGLGTQGALLFQIYKLRIERQRAKEDLPTSPLLTIEEPEAHLHPSAQRSMAFEIARLAGQVVVTSHSPDFLSACRGKVALLSSVAGRSRVKEVGTNEKFFRNYPRAVFGRALILTEGFEADLVPIFASAMRIDLGAAGVEIVNVNGQKSLVPAWELFSANLGIPAVCLADADVEAELLSFHRARKGTTGPSKLSDLVAALEQLDYFTCLANECLELELVGIESGKFAEMAFKEEWPDVSTDDWLASKKSIAGPWCAKVKALTGVTVETRDHLSTLERRFARAVRLAGEKSLPRRVAELMTNDGRDPTNVPPRFKTAIDRAVVLAKG